MPDQPLPEVTGLAVMVGEMRGQLREVVHTLNNVSSKIDGLSREVISMGPIAADLAEVRGEIKLVRAEVDSLRSDRDQRKGATGMLDWIVRNWPGVLGFLFLIFLILKSGQVKL